MICHPARVHLTVNLPTAGRQDAVTEAILYIADEGYDLVLDINKSYCIIIAIIIINKNNNSKSSEPHNQLHT